MMKSVYLNQESIKDIQYYPRDQYPQFAIARNFVYLKYPEDYYIIPSLDLIVHHIQKLHLASH